MQSCYCKSPNLFQFAAYFEQLYRLTAYHVRNSSDFTIRLQLYSRLHELLYKEVWRYTSFVFVALVVVLESNANWLYLCHAKKYFSSRVGNLRPANPLKVARQSFLEIGGKIAILGPAPRWWPFFWSSTRNWWNPIQRKVFWLCRGPQRFFNRKYGPQP